MTSIFPPNMGPWPNCQTGFCATQAGNAFKIALPKMRKHRRILRSHAKNAIHQAGGGEKMWTYVSPLARPDVYLSSSRPATVATLATLATAGRSCGGSLPRTARRFGPGSRTSEMKLSRSPWPTPWRRDLRWKQMPWPDELMDHYGSSWALETGWRNCATLDTFGISMARLLSTKGYLSPSRHEFNHFWHGMAKIQDPIKSLFLWKLRPQKWPSRRN